MAEFTDPPRVSEPWFDEHGSQVDRGDAVRSLDDCLEALLIEVWDCEAEWRFDDRIELAVARDLGRVEPDAHRCHPPEGGTARVFNCPGCGQHWERAVFWDGDTSVWMPA